MALIAPSAVISRISGTIGAVNFARTRNGTVARKALSRPRRQSAVQLDQRAALHNARIQWVALTLDERAAWNAAARDHPTPNRIGVRRNVSGWQLFAGLLCTKGWEVLEDLEHPPRMLKSFPIYNVEIAEAGGPAFNITWAPDTNILTKSCQLFAARPFSSQPLNYLKYWRFIGTRKPADDDWDVYDLFVAAFGVPQSGEILYFKIRIWTYNFLPSDFIPLTLTVA